MGTITHSIEVNAPLHAVYSQWTRFEEFPRFMEGVDEVRQDGPNRLFWKARIGGKEKQWEAELTEQIPNRRIAWRSVEGALNMGAVTFEPLEVSLTRITLTMEYEPEGFIEQAGDALGIPLGQVAENLNRFREFMESGRETGAPTGQIDRVEAPFSADQAMQEEGTWSAEESTEREASARERAVPPAAIVTEAIASGMGTTGRGAIAGEANEPHQKHGTVIADTPRPMAIEGSSIAENTETDRGNETSLGPTHEQIARRAYQLYLERGERPGDAREDWLRAESELSEKAHDNRTA
ncbi:MAG TPA: SRPBCC family protein [Chthoniobacterales bacterium]